MRNKANSRPGGCAKQSQFARRGRQARGGRLEEAVRTILRNKANWAGRDQRQVLYRKGVVFNSAMIRNKANPGAGGPGIADWRLRNADCGRRATMSDRGTADGRNAGYDFEAGGSRNKANLVQDHKSSAEGACDPAIVRNKANCPAGRWWAQPTLQMAGTCRAKQSQFAGAVVAITDGYCIRGGGVVEY